MSQKKGPKVSTEMVEEEARVPLQAVLLADSFAQKFRPITLEQPKVLLPLVNIPMIDYTLEWLASAGVEEVFVFCCAHAKQVIDHLGKSDWGTLPNFEVFAIESRDCVSAGDALRFIDQRNVVRGDFVLVSGDTVSNMSLTKVLQEHRERRKKDKLAVMTMVLKCSKPSPVTHQTRLGKDELLVVTDPESKQLLYYDDGRDSSNMHRNSTRHVVLERTIYAHKSAVLLCNELQDCYIDICSQEVLELFTDNFDYQNLRRDFVKGLLSDEIMGNKIFTYEISGEYAARIDNLRGYASVSKDIIHRWTYPMVPDILFAGNSIGLKIERCYVYKENGVVLPQSAIVGPATVLGEGTVIGEKCIIRNSVIGRGCTIGENVKIEGSYIWNNVTIHDNAQLLNAIICHGAVVESGAVLEPGVVLSFNVIIGKNFTVPAYSKISLIPQPTEEDSSDEELEYAEAASGTAGSPPKPFSGQHRATNGYTEGLVAEVDGARHWDDSEVGVTGAGYRWKDANQEEEWRHSVAPVPAEKIQEMVTKEEQDYLDDAVQDAVVWPDNAANSEYENADEDDEKPENKIAFFDKEVEETFRRAVSETSGVQEDHVILEVNALRLACNTSFSDCAGAIFKAIMNLGLEQPHQTSSELFGNIKRVLLKWRNLLQNYLKTEDDEVEVLLKYEEICLDTGKEAALLFSAVLQVLYDQDIISENAILSWASEKQGADESDKIFVKQSEAFIKWLQEASEEDDA
eukprot:c25616_g1_i1 orf=549-2774(-)